MTTMEIEDVRLLGPTEIAKRLGVSRQRAYIIAGQRKFPPPRWVLAMGSIWWADDVEAYIRKHRPEIAEDTES